MEITRSVQLTFINYYLLEILSILYFVKGQCRHKECQNCFSEIIITLYDHQVWSYYTCTHIGGEERYCFLVEMSKVKITMIQCEQSVLRRTYIEFNQIVFISLLIFGLICEMSRSKLPWVPWILCSTNVVTFITVASTTLKTFLFVIGKCRNVVPYFVFSGQSLHLCSQ